jgi:hypothetical protein
VSSALGETLPGDEILVIDDGSNDNTEQIVSEFHNERIRYIPQANAGAGAARNRGVAEATCDLVAFLDSDDEWFPAKLALQRRFMAVRPDVLFCFTDFAREYGGRRYANSIGSWHDDPRSWQEILGQPVNCSSLMELPIGVGDFSVYTGNLYRGEMHTNYILTSCMVARRLEAGDALYFTEGVKVNEDWECFGRLAQRGPAGYLECETAIQYAHPGARLSDADLLTRAESRLVLLKTVWGSNVEFVATYRDEYLELVRQQELQRMRNLLVLGRMREARDQSRDLAGVPVSYQMLCRLPGRLVVSVLKLRRSVLSPVLLAVRTSLRLEKGQTA